MGAGTFDQGGVRPPFGGRGRPRPIPGGRLARLFRLAASWPDKSRAPVEAGSGGVARRRAGRNARTTPRHRGETRAVQGGALGTAGRSARRPAGEDKLMAVITGGSGAETLVGSEED